MNTAIVFVPGLNNSREVMRPLATHLANRGVTGILLELSGQRPEESPHSGCLATWHNEIEIALEKVRNVLPDGRHYLAGFSMGGAAVMSYVVAREAQQRKGPLPTGILALAPAIEIPHLHRFTKPFLLLEPLRPPCPSLLPPRYAAHRIISLTQYRNLLDARKCVRTAPSESDVHSLPLFLALHKRDELISYRRSLQWFKKHRNKAFSLHEVATSARLANHFFIQEQEIGQEAWDAFLQAIESFLSAPGSGEDKKET